MAPPPPPQGILGRDDDLARVFDLLQLGDTEADDVPPVAFRGLGGIGKTTLAAAFGRLSGMPERFPDGVLWTALGPQPTLRILLDDWGRFVGRGPVARNDENACTRPPASPLLYRKRALVIVDDVWEALHGSHFMVAGPHCHTLITTHKTQVAYALATRDRTFRVDVLKPQGRAGVTTTPGARGGDDRSARPRERLCERLEYLPLALALAGRLLAVEADVPSRMARLLGELIEQRHRA